MLGNDEERYIKPISDEFGLFRGILFGLGLIVGAIGLLWFIAWLMRSIETFQ